MDGGVDNNIFHLEGFLFCYYCFFYSSRGFIIMASNFWIRSKGWWSSTRGLSQIWLLVIEESKKKKKLRFLLYYWYWWCVGTYKLSKYGDFKKLYILKNPHNNNVVTWTQLFFFQNKCQLYHSFTPPLFLLPGCQKLPPKKKTFLV
jgi:hypothetical protein